MTEAVSREHLDGLWSDLETRVQAGRLFDNAMADLPALADIYYDGEDYPRAEALYRQALASYQMAGVERGQDVAQLGIGIVHLDHGALEQAEWSLPSAWELALAGQESALHDRPQAALAFEV